MTISIKFIGLLATASMLIAPSLQAQEQPTPSSVVESTEQTWVQLPGRDWFVHTTTLKREAEAMTVEVYDLAANRYRIFSANCQSGTAQLIYTMNVNTAAIEIYRPGSNLQLERQEFQQQFANFVCNLPTPPTPDAATPAAN